MVAALIILSIAPPALAWRNGTADGDYVLAVNTGINLVGGLDDFATGR